jgi:two-component system, chemotaxis family, sensor kinase CheA
VTLVFDATDGDLQLFLEEAAEQLKTLSDGLLEMERDAADAQLIQAVFRAAHTLKGSSATIGHTRMAKLTHGLENVLDAIRNGKLEPASAVIDALLAGVDALHELNEEVSTRVECDIPLDTLVARLHAVATAPKQAVASGAPQTLSGAEAARLAEAANKCGGRPLAVEVAIDAASEWPAVRAYQALMELAALGIVVRSWPSEAELQNGDCDGTLLVILASDAGDAALQTVVTAVADVTTVRVRPHAAPAASDERTPTPIAAAPVLANEERRKIDLGPETRGASVDEQLVQAGVRLTRLSRMVKVDIAQLDEMMNLVGELVIGRGRLVQVLRALTAQLGSTAEVEQLADIAQHLSRTEDELQQTVMNSRMLPVESVFNRFPRMVRDLSRKSGKVVDFVMAGGETGLDRSVIDEIGDPLLHLLRNALDHGIETSEERTAAGKPVESRLLLSAEQSENRIVIAVEDDGRGIDPQRMRETAVRKGLLKPDAAARLSDAEAVQLIFLPGFSSKEQVTEVSGRGVGMDIVRTNIERVGGTVEIETRLGKGTAFRITMPLTLAIIRALLVRVGEHTFTLPLSSVKETLRVRADAIHAVHHREVVVVRGQTLSLARLGELYRLSTPRQRPHDEWCYIATVRSGAAELGLIIDELVGEQEVVIKAMDGVLGSADGVAGATILGDGSVSIIVDVPKVIGWLSGVLNAAA